MKKILMVAYHFPPLAGSSGIQRTLRFVQQLPAHGWQPIVVSAHPRAYERTSDDLLRDVPDGTIVERAQAFDTARHFAVQGRYIGAMARPDRWVSWKFDAVRRGLSLVRKHAPSAIWSTYPIATAHLIGEQIARRTGLPWIADFRDPMAQEGYPADPITRRQFEEIEARAVASAHASTFTTPGAATEYRQRYPTASSRIYVLENGYDEDSFTAAEASVGQARSTLNPGAITLLHSGIVYPQERDPTHLMRALRKLHLDGAIHPAKFRLRFRAPVQEDLLRSLGEQNGVSEYIEILPAIGYRDALREMLNADALLVMQAGDCNQQIPAKIYEYLRARRPIVCLSVPEGDTYGVLRAAGLDTFARIDDESDIAATLKRWLDAGIGQAALPNEAYVARCSRSNRTSELASLLDRLASVSARAQ